MRPIIATLAIGDIFRSHAKFISKQIAKLDQDIEICITTDKYFDTDTENVYFNILPRTISAEYGCYFKAYAIKYAASIFPNKSICYLDADQVIHESQKSFHEIFQTFDLKNTLYCFADVSCSGSYDEKPEYNDGRMVIIDKFKKIAENFMPGFNDYENIRFPIETILFFSQIQIDKLISFCESWIEIGKFAKDMPGNDCWEIGGSCVLNKIDIRKKHGLPFGNRKGWWMKDKFRFKKTFERLI